MIENYTFINEQNQLSMVLGKLDPYNQLCIDLECGGLNPWQNTLLLIQIATPDETFVIDTRRVNIEPLKPILESPHILKILQNAKFDYQFLKLQKGITLHNIYDTMIAEHLLNAGRIGYGQSKLQHLAWKYAGIELEKPQGLMFDEHINIFTEQQLEYATKDAAILWDIFRVQKDELESEGLVRIALLEFDVLPAIAEMELNGVLINKEGWKDFLGEVEETKQEHARILYDFFAPTRAQQPLIEGVIDINLRSVQQVRQAFIESGIDLPDTQQTTLKRIGHPATLALIEYRKYSKFLSTYGENIFEFINPVTGRIHADFGQAFTDSGRLSCRDPNLQNIPIKDTPRFRQCFIADEGNKLISADYGQIELRIIADHSQDRNLIRAFNSGEDIHTLTARAVFDKENITESERKAAKNMVYGMSYGISYEGFARRWNMDVPEAKRLLQEFNKHYPKANNWLYYSGKRAIARGYARTKLGRKRWFVVEKPIDWKDWRIHRLMREARNHPVQGGSADMIKLALAAVQKDFAKGLINRGVKLILSVHDEICVEAPEEEVEEVKSIMAEEMIKAGEKIVESVPIEVDFTVGDTWYKEKEEK